MRLERRVIDRRPEEFEHQRVPSAGFPVSRPAIPLNDQVSALGIQRSLGRGSCQTA
jgi:hypothetical protein